MLCDLEICEDCWSAMLESSSFGVCLMFSHDLIEVLDFWQTEQRWFCPQPITLGITWGGSAPFLTMLTGHSVNQNVFTVHSTEKLTLFPFGINIAREYLRRCTYPIYYQLLPGNVSDSDFLTALLLLHLSASILLQGRMCSSFYSFFYISRDWWMSILFNEF